MGAGSSPRPYSPGGGWRKPHPCHATPAAPRPELSLCGHCLMTDLTAIQTIVIVMLENRSFDHILGHLSCGALANGTAVDGLKEPLQREAYENLFEGESYYP